MKIIRIKCKIIFVAIVLDSFNLQLTLKVFRYYIKILQQVCLFEGPSCMYILLHFSDLF